MITLLAKYNILDFEIDAITSSQSLMIIRCCGELVPEETFENRTKLVQEVWATMEKLSKLLIEHFIFEIGYISTWTMTTVRENNFGGFNK
jgi:hypothetical protein